LDDGGKMARHQWQEAAMAHVADHLSVAELEQRYRDCADGCTARHYQLIWILAQGHTIV
jgi:hypothetical protein